MNTRTRTLASFFTLAMAAMLLGAGRDTVESAIDPAVGVLLHKKCGELVIEGEPLLEILASAP